MPAARRKYDTGLERPQRPCPHDFRERYIELGWETIVEHYRTNWRCVRRWINEVGREDLRRERAEYVRGHGLRFLHGASQQRERQLASAAARRMGRVGAST